MIYPHNHPPPHIHIVGPEERAKVMLNCPDGQLVPTDIRGMDRQTTRQIMMEISAKTQHFCEAWERIHGTH